MEELKIEDLNKDWNGKNFNPLKKKQVKKVSIEEIGSEVCCEKPSIVKKTIKRISKIKTEKDYSLIDKI